MLRYSITGKMTGKSYGPTEMIIRGLPGWLAWFAGGWGNPIPPGKYKRPASAAVARVRPVSCQHSESETSRQLHGSRRYPQTTFSSTIRRQHIDLPCKGEPLRPTVSLECHRLDPKHVRLKARTENNAWVCTHQNAVGDSPLTAS